MARHGPRGRARGRAARGARAPARRGARARTQGGHGARGRPLAAADDEDALGEWLERHGVREAWELAPALVAARLTSPSASAWPRRPARRSGRRSPGSFPAPTPPGGGRARGARPDAGRAGPAGARARDRRHARGRRRPAGLTAFGSELNQVWTNLVANALDAARSDGGAAHATRGRSRRGRGAGRRAGGPPSCGHGSSSPSPRRRSPGRGPASGSRPPGASSCSAITGSCEWRTPRRAARGSSPRCRCIGEPGPQKCEFSHRDWVKRPHAEAPRGREHAPRDRTPSHLQPRRRSCLSSSSTNRPPGNGRP